MAMHVLLPRQPLPSVLMQESILIIKKYSDMDAFFTVRFGIKIMEALACLAGFLCWAKLSPRFWRAFPFYLLIITCCEFAGWYMNGHGIKGSRAMYSYFVIPLEFLFMHFLYYKNLPRYFRKTVIGLSAIYVAALFAEQLFLQQVKWIWLSMSYTIGNITLLVLGIIYFLQLFSSEKIADYKRQLFFWVNLGLMLFYVGTCPYYAMFKTLYETQPALFHALAWVSVILNYVMYGFFIIGFLWSRKER